LYPELTIDSKEIDEGIEWLNFHWWLREVWAGLKGPRGVINTALALIGMACNLCAGPVVCPIQTPVLVFLAAYYSITQVRDDIYSRKRGGVIGLISALIIAGSQILAAMSISICVVSIDPWLSALSSNSDFSILESMSGLSFLFGSNLLTLIFSGILGYFTGYLSVISE